VHLGRAGYHGTSTYRIIHFTSLKKTVPVGVLGQRGMIVPVIVTAVAEGKVDIGPAEVYVPVLCKIPP